MLMWIAAYFHGSQYRFGIHGVVHMDSFGSKLIEFFKKIVSPL